MVPGRKGAGGEARLLGSLTLTQLPTSRPTSEMALFPVGAGSSDPPYEIEAVILFEIQHHGQKPASILDGCPPNDPRAEFTFSPATTVFPAPMSPLNPTVAKRVPFGDN